MSRRALAVLAMAILLLASLLPSAALAAQPQSNPSRFKQIDVGKIDKKLTPAILASSTKQLSIILELSGKPVAVRQAEAGRRLATATASSYRAQLKAVQDALIPRITALGGRVVGQMQTVYNGIHVRIAAGKVTALAALPGVVGVHQATVFQRENTKGIPYINAPQAWTSPGVTGTGKTIGVIDTGIDFYHADFGGSGVPADFVYGKSAGRDLVVPAFNSDGTTQAFPSVKVPGGFDLVGDSYNADPTDPAFQPIPHPDPNPLDCDSSTAGNVGHGTHVAGTAAGYGVLSTGATFGGPYNTSTISGNTWLVGPGVAPGAAIRAYRVFGCAGSTDVVVEALDRAVADGVDVINMSLGSDFGPGDTTDAVASDNAAAAGVVVVASSGNGGSGAYITGSPAASSRTISVAALDATQATLPGAIVQLASGDVTGIDANSGTLPVTGNLNVLSNGAGGVGLGCADSDYAGVTAGQIVVTHRGTCARTDRAKFGQAHGAAAVILINNSSGLPPFEGDIPGVTIPFVGVAQGTDAAFLAENGTSITIVAGGPITNTGYQNTASFSSWGPRNFDSMLKPDVTAPGVSIVSAAAGQGTIPQTLSGTSMASPHTAGAALLVLQNHPGWSNVATRVDRVKGALMGTANADGTKILNYDPRADGAGVIDAARAVNTLTTVSTTDHNESLSFGYRPMNAAFSETRSFTIWNDTASNVDYALSTGFVGGDQGSTIALASGGAPATMVTAPANGHVTVDVTINLDAAAVAALAEADTFAGAGPGDLTSIRGAIVATQSAGAPDVFDLRVPFMLVPRGLSDLTASPHTPFQNHNGISSSTTRLDNTGIHGTNADVYAWGLWSPNDPASGTNDIRAVGAQAFDATLSPTKTKSVVTVKQVVFAVNTWNRWTNGSFNEFDILIDTDRDGAPDFAVVGIDLGFVLGGSYNGIMAAFTVDSGGNIIDAFIADSPMNGSTILLPTLASDLGLTPSSGPFQYMAQGFSLDGTAPDFVSGAARFDPFNPAISNGNPLIGMAPGSTSNLALWLDQGRFANAPAKGWMIVGLDDPNGDQQADLLPIGKVAARFGGGDRYTTAAVISRNTFAPGRPFVYVASGLNFPDGLAGSPAAARDGGPLLLVPPSGPLPASVTTELARLAANQIVILGGTGAVSNGVKTALQAYSALPVKRISGADRYATAAAISSTFASGVSVAYVATGVAFPDALTAGPAAALNGGPLLLVPGTGPLPASVKTELGRLKPSKIVVVGGTGAVSDAEKAELAGLPFPHTISRTFGADRYATAVAISAATFGIGVPAVYVATGLDFPDAMAGSAAAGHVGGPVLLVRQNEIPAVLEPELIRLEPQQIWVLGGTGVVSDLVADGLGPFIMP